MATLSTNKAGARRILFVSPDGKRQSLWLGTEFNKKQAEAILTKIEYLLSAQASRQPLDNETAKWVAGIGDNLAKKLAAVGLIEPRTADVSLESFLNDYLAKRMREGKGSTALIIKQTITDLLGFLDGTRSLREFKPSEAEDFKQHLLGRKLASATIARRLRMARMLFGVAVDAGQCDANPFAKIKSPPAGPNKARQHYVSVENARKVLEHCNPEWRIAIALARFAGLRCPSEVFTLKWADVDLVKGRMTVTAPKTEHHADGGVRIVPITGELHPYLQDAFELAADAGAVYVVNGIGETGRAKARKPCGWTGVSLATRFAKLVRRAGLVSWPKGVHNLRASCETDWIKLVGIKSACDWIGNTPIIALKHYAQTTPDDFRRALEHGKSIEAAGEVLTRALTQPATAPKELDSTDSDANPVVLSVLSVPVESGQPQSGDSNGRYWI